MVVTKRLGHGEGEAKLVTVYEESLEADLMDFMDVKNFVNIEIMVRTTMDFVHILSKIHRIHVF